MNKHKLIKISLVVSFLATALLALASLTIFFDNEIVNLLHMISGGIFSILIIFHLVSHFKKHKK
jgi:fatty acid desaturase